MSEKYLGKYRNGTTRLQPWNYGAMGAYFITLCTKYREPYFGKIANGKMHLSQIGKIAESEWLKTIEIRKDMNLELSEFVVMPNHFHAIISIGENEFNKNEYKGSISELDFNKSEYQGNKFGPQSNNLASIIRGFNHQ